MNFNKIDKKISLWLLNHGPKFLRYSLAIIFIWFGALKIFNVSPAAELVKATVTIIKPEIFLPILGLWEITIGICFLFRKFLRIGIAILIPQMIGTFLPLITLTYKVFQNGNLLAPTLEGQYIIKNLFIIGAAMVVGATVRNKEDKL